MFFRPGFRPAPSAFVALCKNTERIAMKFAGGNQYQQHINLHFEQNRNRDWEAGYNRKVDSASIIVAAMSNRC